MIWFLNCLLLTAPLFGSVLAPTDDLPSAVKTVPEAVLEKAADKWKAEGTSKTVDVSLQVFQEQQQQVHRFRLMNSGQHQMITIISPRPASLMHDDFAAQVRLHSTRAGIQLALRVVLPNQQDPRTNQPLVTMVFGSVYRKDSTWQVLHAAGTRAALESQLRRLRVELHRSEINTQNAYINGLALLVEAAPGETYLDIAVSEYGPVVSDSRISASSTTAMDEVPEVTVAEPAYHPLRVELNHVLLNDRPTILRLAPDHGEPVHILKQLGLNGAWIPDCRDQDRASQLYEAGLAVLATPPQPSFEPGDYSRVLQALPPLDQLCPGVSIWLLGTRVSPDQLPHFLALSRETRSADRKLRRPQMADVTAAEGAASREVELVGIGRHVVGRDDTFGQLRNQTFRRQRGAGQLSFPWMWIQTEPSSQQQSWRRQTLSRMPHVEPEQIAAQVYAAISAGCKGVGYWKTRTLQPDQALDQETLGAIELINLELALLEPLLARGRVDGHLLIQSADTSNNAAGRRPAILGSSQPWIQSALSSSPLSAGTMVQEEPDGPDATVITSGGSMLILVNYWDTISQFVPSPMYSKEISMVVAASETASAWQLTTTGIRALRQEVTAGGLKLRIQDFDRHAAILITSDPELIRSLEKNIYQAAERSSQLTLEIASLKYRRVLATTEELREYSAVPTEVSRLFTIARQSLDRAQHESSQKDFHETVLFSRSALRTLRQIQQLCWRESIRGMVSPTAAPDTISFATLPDHWEMIEQLRARADQETKNLLPPGNFEHWQKSETSTSGYLCTADVIADTGAGQGLLRLAAWMPNSQQSISVPRDIETPLVVTSPPIAVEEGDIVRITGRFRKGRVVPTLTRRPLLLFDSEMGPECGVQLAAESEWNKFEIIRRIAPQSNSFRFSAALTSVAEVHLDDLSITRIPQTKDEVSHGPLKLTGGSRELNPAAQNP